MRFIVYGGLLCTLPLFGTFSSWYNHGRAIDQAKKGLISESEQTLNNLLINDPDNAGLLYDKGVNALELFKANDDVAHAKNAYEYFKRAANSGSVTKEQQEQAAYNAGNAAYLCEQLADALSWYERVLSMNPVNTYAQHNKDVVLKKLREQEEKKQQQEKQQEQNSQNQKKDNKQNQDDDKQGQKENQEKQDRNQQDQQRDNQEQDKQSQDHDHEQQSPESQSSENTPRDNKRQEQKKNEQRGDQQDGAGSSGQKEGDSEKDTQQRDGAKDTQHGQHDTRDTGDKEGKQKQGEQPNNNTNQSSYAQNQRHESKDQSNNNGLHQNSGQESEERRNAQEQHAQDQEKNHKETPGSKDDFAKKTLGQSNKKIAEDQQEKNVVYGRPGESEHAALDPFMTYVLANQEKEDKALQKKLLGAAIAHESQSDKEHSW